MPVGSTVMVSEDSRSWTEVEGTYSRGSTVARRGRRWSALLCVLRRSLGMQCSFEKRVLTDLEKTVMWFSEMSFSTAALGDMLEEGTGLAEVKGRRVIELVELV